MKTLPFRMDGIGRNLLVGQCLGRANTPLSFQWIPSAISSLLVFVFLLVIVVVTVIGLNARPSCGGGFPHHLLFLGGGDHDRSGYFIIHVCISRVRLDLY